MNKKSKKHRTGIVFSTDPEFEYEYDDGQEEETLEPSEQNLRTKIEKKGRKGKVVTIVSGFVGTSGDLEALAKRLKTSCGVGGSAKDGEIVLQGDLRKKASRFLSDWGYRNK